MTNQDFSGIGGDLYFGDPEAAQPDWRDGDPDNETSDDDDPAPISTRLLSDMIGFDPDEWDDDDGDDAADDGEETGEIEAGEEGAAE